MGAQIFVIRKLFSFINKNIAYRAFHLKYTGMLKSGIFDTFFFHS